MKVKQIQVDNYFVISMLSSCILRKCKDGNIISLREVVYQGCFRRVNLEYYEWQIDNVPNREEMDAILIELPKVVKVCLASLEGFVD